MSWFKEMMGQLSLEFPVRNKNISELAAQLESSGKEIVNRINAAQPDSEENQAQMRHIIGIERWGHRRLRGFLGSVPPEDEYDEYCPESGLDLMEQIALFREARAKTVYLGIQIESLFVEAAKAAPIKAEAVLTIEAADAHPTEVNHSGSDNLESNTNNSVPYTVRHNEFGPLTPRGWLRYLEMHARMESKRIK